MKSNYNLFLALFMMLITQISFAQVQSVSGVVTDESGTPIPGVNVLVKNSKTGTQTNLDGKYSIEASEGSVLEFSFIGNKNATIKVGKSNTYNVVMQNNLEALDEVVVIGYGTQKKKEVTGSVSQIKGSSIQGLITPSFESQLAGRASGVQVTTPTGIVGAAPRVRIRGIASINSGTQPLYVVDGMPMYSGDIGGYADTNALGDINPNDIESFDILKDGAALAIYGSRGANGVILISTKKGKKGAMKVNYNVTSGFASPYKSFDLLKTADFLTISNEKRTNAGQPAWAAGSNYDTDWQKAVLNSSAYQMDHNMSFSGGNDQTKYYMSMGYSTQEGIAVSNEMARYSIKSSLEHQINKWLTIGGNIGLTRTEYNGLNTGRNSLSGNIFNAIRQLPNTSIFDSTNPTGYNINLSTGNVGQGTNLQPVGDNISNIGYVLNFNKFQSKINRSIITAFAAVDIAKGLNYRFQANADNAITGGFLYWNPIHGDGRGSNGRLQNSNTDLMRWNTQNILNYNKTFFDNHNVSATTVLEYQKERNQSFFGVGTNLLDEFYNQNLVTGSYGTQESGGGISESGIMSYIGRFNYNYKQKYFLQGSIRKDGLSKLSEETRWQSFTGYSAGWNISKEGFMSNLNKYISDFKIRASYAEVGNTEIGTYPYLGLTSASQYGALNGIAFTQFGNDLLKWETSKKTDYGIDLAVLDNKVKLTFDYFKNESDGLVLNSPVPPSLGVPNNSISKNIGTMVNDGYEFGLDVSLINNQKFRWDVNANVTLQSNKVSSTPNGADLIGGTSTDVNISPNIIIRQGESLNSLYGFEYWGVNPANGFPVYYKADGSLVQGNPASQAYSVFNPSNPSNTSTAATLTQADKRILGSSIPKYFGGFSSRMSYKNVDLSFLIRFSGGNKIFNSTRRDLMNQNLNNNSTEILGRWQSASNPGDGWTPILYANSNTFLNQSSNATTRFVENGDFISFDNVTLGYNFPKKIIEKIKVENIRLFVQGQNLFMITDYTGLNPEMETAGVDLNGTPIGRIFSMGINVKL